MDRGSTVYCIIDTVRVVQTSKQIKLKQTKDKPKQSKDQPKQTKDQPKQTKDQSKQTKDKPKQNKFVFVPPNPLRDFSLLFTS